VPTLAIPITTVKIIGAIQWTFGGPRVVQAKPKRPIGRQGMTGHYVVVRTDRYIVFAVGVGLTIEQPPQPRFWGNRVRAILSPSLSEHVNGG
jgi:hypothetical protein